MAASAPTRSHWRVERRQPTYRGVGPGIMGCSNTRCTILVGLAWGLSICSRLTAAICRETLALEEPTALLPFLSFLTSPTSASADLTALSDRSLKLISQLPAPLGAHVALSAQLQPNETYALLEHALTQSKLVRSQGHRESLRLALGAREASVAIEGMRLVEEHREREVILRPDDNVQAEETCLSWLDVGGAFVSSEEEFWRLVGEEQRQQSTPILVPGR